VHEAAAHRTSASAGDGGAGVHANPNMARPQPTFGHQRTVGSLLSLADSRNFVNLEKVSADTARSTSAGATSRGQLGQGKERTAASRILELK
jgi:hypothetical protein